MPSLILGPLLRWVGESEATVWVETDAPCEVRVLGSSARTFRVGSHHYALVRVTGLAPGGVHAYDVALDGERRWPETGSTLPPPVIRTLGHEGLRIVFGSCRVAVPHGPPYSLSKDQDPRGKERDALLALARRMIAEDPSRWPHALLLLGDQEVYVDEGSARARAFIRSRRDTSRAPGEEPADFEEYTRLYWESWQDPMMRWLLSTLPSAMIFDDHEVHDDWNTSEAWVREMDRRPWWRERLIGAFVSYWLYQHLGNLAPQALEQEPLWHEVRAAGDAEPALRAYAERCIDHADGTRWSFARDLGRTRVVVLDSRGGRVLRDGRRRMVDDEEWAWIAERATGDVDHLLLASSLPVFLPPGAHHLEAWDEAVAAGAWGRPAARLAERLRRALDLEHWAAFGESFGRLVSLIRQVGAGARGTPPASIVLLGGDVHHAYLARVGFRRSAAVRSAVWQAVCSPFRNPLDARERRAIRIIGSAPASALTAALARAAGVPAPEARWRLVEPPVFDNQIATLDIRGRRAAIVIERTEPGVGAPRLHESRRWRLA